MAEVLESCDQARLRAGESTAPGAINRQLARTLFLAAVRADRLNQPAEALRLFERAVAYYTRLDQSGDRETDDRMFTGVAHHIIGRLYLEQGRPSQALKPLRTAIAIREGLCRDYPATPAFSDDCGGSWHRLGEALELSGQNDEALVAYSRGLELRRRPDVQGPERLQRIRGLDEHLDDLSRLLVKLNRPTEAVAAFRERMALVPGDPRRALRFAGELGFYAIVRRPTRFIGSCCVDRGCRTYATAALALAQESGRLLQSGSQLADAKR